MRIVQISTSDKAGGAEAVAWQLFQSYRRRGYDSSLLVGEKRSQDPDVYELKHDEHRSAWSRMWAGVAERLGATVGPVRGARYMQAGFRFIIGQPGRVWASVLGREDFDFPGTAHVLDMVSDSPDIVHCHNLHGGGLREGGYFDLGLLPQLSHTVPTIVTLHDAWMLSGHCAHSFDCERWKTGCGACPDLTIYPSIKRDATAFNWRRKQEIFARSKLFVATPSRWLMDKVEASMLQAAIIEQRVIPNGINLSVFSPADQRQARARLGLPLAAKILMFAANGVKENVWKDYRTLCEALSRLSLMMEGCELLLIALGEDKPTEKIGAAHIRFIPHEPDPNRVALYYQAADVYLHAARADTFPNTVIEATACGTPVVATAVGGIPEQVLDGQSGFLVPAGDAESMARHARWLLEDEGRRRVISAQAAQIAKVRFDLNRQVQDYLNWYEHLTKSSQGKSLTAHAC